MLSSSCRENYLVLVKSKCFYERIQSLKLLNNHQVELIWLSEHHDIKGYKKADEYFVSDRF